MAEAWNCPSAPAGAGPLSELYVVAPSHGARAALDRANQTIRASLEFLVRGEEPDDAARAVRLRAEHAGVGGDLGRMLAARDAGDVATARALEDRRLGPLYAALEAEAPTLP